MISIKFPFNESTEGGVFKTTKTTAEKIRTNLISLLTTKKRQRIMHNDLYSPLFDYIFELWDEISADKLKSDLTDKISIFFPEINIEDIVFTFNDSTYVLSTKIVYSILELAGTIDTIEIEVQTQPTNTI